MSRYLHQLVGYGVGAVSFLALGLGVNRQAQAVPFVARVHAISEPKGTHLFDQRTKGGERFDVENYCRTETQLLVESSQSLPQLRAYYESHPVEALHGSSMVAGKVHPIGEVKKLEPRWEKFRQEKNLFVVDFISPGSPGSESVCRQ